MSKVRRFQSAAFISMCLAAVILFLAQDAGDVRWVYVSIALGAITIALWVLIIVFARREGSNHG